MGRRTNRVGLVAVIAVVLVVRRRFFYGKFLDADDLRGEQDYRRCRRRLR